ncbi:hypothetical protein [Mycobacterium sp.]|uniref:hypothetical protein n=1 Tax=Mycobacterium sp. TaxID=1785 RepID=UPI0025FD864E|nr:hypothetical protein [Mycobacterium sp.]
MSETLGGMHLANETSDNNPATAPFGWCDTSDSHDGRFDHRQQPGCRNFISDAEHTDWMLRQARLSDQHVQVLYPSGATNPEAAYIADYRPY